MAAGFRWGGWKIRVVGGHAGAKGDRQPYQKKIDYIEFIVEHTPRDHIVILGMDTQHALDPQQAFDDPDIIGEYAMGHRDWRGEWFLRLLYT